MTRSLHLIPILIAALALAAHADHHAEVVGELADAGDVAATAEEAVTTAVEKAEAHTHEHAGHAGKHADHGHGEHAGHDHDAEHGDHGAAAMHADGHAEHAHADGDHDTDAGHAMLVTHAVAVMRPTEGNTAYGVVWFEQLDETRVKVTADISGLTPNASHGFHVHEYGDVTAANGSATGGHYNPEGHDHALPTSSDTRHAGDLGNLHADANGDADFGLIVDNLSLAGMNSPVIGRGVIIHAKPDDGGQPTGNAGARIAQGVIGVTKAPGTP